MLTIDDCNTLLEKYKDANWFYELDFSTIDSFPTQIDFLRIDKQVSTIPGTAYYFEVSIVNKLFTGLHYIKNSQGEFVRANNADVSKSQLRAKIYVSQEVADNPTFIFGMNFCYNSPHSYGATGDLYEFGLLPISSTIQSKLSNDETIKFYIDPLGYSDSKTFLVNDETVPLEQDDAGYYLTIPNGEDCVLKVNTSTYDTHSFFNVVFREFKSIPPMSIPVLYKGTPQEVKVYNEDTEEYITDFQAYYQGRKLKDNIIELPYDAPNVVDITVDLLDPEYPESTVKLKANTEIKLCTSIAQITNAIEQGIQTLQVHTPSGRTQLLVDELTFNNVTFINSKILFEKCILNNVTITQTEGYNEGLLILSQGTVLNDCTIQNLRKLIVEAIEFNNCTLKKINSVGNYILHQPGVIQITGTITDCNFDRSIVFSDGNITLLNNTFNRISSKQYFPNFLYLTGDYTVKNNVFTLKGEWEELAFNMCIIKANNDFNPSVFINDNLFDLNIVYEDEPTNTFYYCLVDDDKIRAVRLQ